MNRRDLLKKSMSVVGASVLTKVVADDWIDEPPEPEQAEIPPTQWIPASNIYHQPAREIIDSIDTNPWDRDFPLLLRTIPRRQVLN